MIKIRFDSGPPQLPITRERIQEMITWAPRRFRLTDFDRPLKAPGEFGDNPDWNLMFPFRETFVPAFEAFCSIDHLTFMRKEGKPSCYTFLKPRTDGEIEEVKIWIEIISPYIAIRDCLALSFALDYDKEGGDPKAEQTEIGNLRSRAKIYDESKPTRDTYSAADQLVATCLDFLRKVRCYDYADAVVGMPPSSLDKPFDLPKHLASKVASQWGKEDLCEAVRTVSTRPLIKNLRLENKLEALEGTIDVEPEQFEGRIVLLIDDLYQSGVSMNYVAMLLLEAGARKVYGLACEKTCRNDDNLSGRES